MAIGTEIRHSAASLTAAHGVPLEQLADVLGHGGTRMAAVVYRHVLAPTVGAGADPMRRIARQRRGQPGRCVGSPFGSPAVTAGHRERDVTASGLVIGGDLTGQLSNPPQALKTAADQHHPPASDDDPAPRPSATVQRRLRTDDLDRLVARYDAGMTVIEPATLGLHRTTISAQLQRHGKGTRTPGLTTNQAAEAAQLYADGLSTARLADRYGVSPNTVNAALRRRSIEIRRPGRPQRRG